MAWIETKERFVNPYNFVPFEGICQRSFIGPMPGELTGYIECKMELLTPLIIPNTSNDKALHKCSNDLTNNGYSYDFFSYTDLETAEEAAVGKYRKPMIPGSEIRGAVRSVFETAFNGCMSSVDLKRPLGRRSAVPKKPGILKKVGDQWEIIPCQRWMLKTQISNLQGKMADIRDWPEGKQLYVTGKPYKKNDRNTDYFLVLDYSEKMVNSNEWKLGYLHKGEAFTQKKHHESVFVVSENVPKITITKEDVDRLEEVIRQYQDPKLNAHIRKSKEGWYSEYKVKEEGTLIYYHKEIGMPVYMAPACISKEVFGQSIGNLLQENGGYQPCEGRDDVCSACALFGMVAKGSQASGHLKETARASRLRFEDAFLVNPPEDDNYSTYYLQDMRLPDMGEPKPSAVEFYTLPPTKPSEDRSYEYWTYDYKMDGKKRSPLSKQEPKLRGRKFYWHSEAWKRFTDDREEPMNMKQKVRPLKCSLDHTSTPITFHFRVYFENITGEELQRLRWALTFDDPTCAHKIGRAKPLGFGSVIIHVMHVYLRRIDQNTGEWSLEPQLVLQDHEIADTEPIKVLKIMANWLKRPIENVSYPVGQAGGQNGKVNNTSSHQWFLGNRNQKGGNSMRPKFAKILPKPQTEIGTNSQECLNGLYKDLK